MKGLLSRLSRRFAGQPEVPVDAAGAESIATSTQLFGQALQMHRAGHLADAQSMYERVLAADPANFDALHMLGALAHQTGHPDRAIELIGRAVDVRPDDVSARTNLGLVFRQMGRLDQAEGALRRAVQLNPESDHALASLGVVLRDRGDLSGAEAEFVAALQCNPDNDEAMSNLASICREMHRHPEAESHFRAALALRPDRIEYWSNLAGLYIERSEWSEAEVCLRAAHEKGEATAETLSHLGFVLLQLDRPNEAEVACRDAVNLRADYPDALVNLGSVLNALGDQAGAEDSFRRVLALDATHVAALVNLGTIRKEVGDFTAAEANFRRAIEVDPRSSGAKFNLSNLLLLHGEYREGFALFESRFSMFRGHFKRTSTEQFLQDGRRRWHGEPISGRRMIVWSEQGSGDNLMMMRYLPLLKQRGADHVTFVCEPELARVAAGVFGVDSVVMWDSAGAHPDYDLHCPAMSLPHCFHSTTSTIPACDSRVVVPENLIKAWRDRLAHIAVPRVGLVWAGNPTLRDDAKRSIALGAFAPILGLANMQFLSLQKGRDSQPAGSLPATLLDFMDECRDFMDTAAFISNLDLVISVDTAVAHLAGTLGKPVWLLNRASSEWRWGLTGERTPWYRTMRIFRQEQPSNWAPVLNRVAAELKTLTAVQ